MSDGSRFVLHNPHSMLLLLMCVAGLASCGGGSSAGGSPGSYSIGGTVSGLSSGNSLHLLDNGADSLTVGANGGFTFTTGLASGSAYAVTVGTAPAGETCTVTGGAGAVASANITSVQVSCTAIVTAGESLLYSFGAFGGPDGAYPNSMLQASDGNFYGVTQSGGANNTGTVFELTAAGSESIVYSMDANVVNGVVETADPVTLIEAADRSLWGVAHNGGVNGTGGIFMVSGGAGSLVYSFAAAPPDGNYPTGLIQGSDGNFYGTTTNGGAHFVGTFFRVTPGGVETVLYSFGAATGDAASPISSLVQGSDGAFYGASTGGGANTTGAVFRITAAGTETVLYSFGPQSGTDGRSVSGGLIQASDGNFYGLTNEGGANGTGVVYRVTPAGGETVVYSFAPPTNGINPRPIGPLLQGSDGNFYGTTQAGGTLNSGTVFELTPGGVETTLHSFTAQGTDVAEPLGGVLQGTDGNLYGTGSAGGAHSTGGVFRLTL